MGLLDINLLGGSTHSGQSEYGPSGPDFNEFDYSIEAFKDGRIKYGAALSEEHGRHFGLHTFRSYWVRMPIWLRGFFSDFWPHWGLFGGLPLYRGLSALLLLGLLVSVLKVYLRDFLELAEERFSGTPGGRFGAQWCAQVFARWRERSAANLRVYSREPRAPYFKDFYGLKFYYGLKFSGRLSLASPGVRVRGPWLRVKVHSWRHYQEF